MPILAVEPDRFPSNLLDGEFEAAPHAWWVLHTRPRQEKSLTRRLYATGRSYYLPTMPRRHRIRGRVVTAHVPLFTGYVFLHANRDECLHALASQRVVHVLPVPNQQSLWRDLRQVDRLLSSGSPISPEERLGPGDEIEVTSGPLAGLTGTIVRTATGQRFVVRVDFIQRGASVELDDFALVPRRRSGLVAT